MIEECLLKVEHENGEDEMRMWLPAFKRVRRISVKKKVTRLWDLILLSKTSQIEILTQ